MQYRVILTLNAKTHIISAVRWYQRSDPNVAYAFLAETGAMIGRIEQYPHSFQIFRGSIRRAVFRRFPYSIYFLLKTELAVVLAVLHHRQSDMLRPGVNNGGSEQRTE